MLEANGAGRTGRTESTQYQAGGARKTTFDPPRIGVPARGHRLMGIGGPDPRHPCERIKTQVQCRIMADTLYPETRRCVWQYQYFVLRIRIVTKGALLQMGRGHTVGSDLRC